LAVYGAIRSFVFGEPAATVLIVYLPEVYPTMARRGSGGGDGSPCNTVKLALASQDNPSRETCIALTYLVKYIHVFRRTLAALVLVLLVHGRIVYTALAQFAVGGPYRFSGGVCTGVMVSVASFATARGGALSDVACMVSCACIAERGLGSLRGGDESVLVKGVRAWSDGLRPVYDMLCAAEKMEEAALADELSEPVRSSRST
jgi:hypothetical protein